MTHKRSSHILHGAVISTIILIMQMFAALVKVKVILSAYGHEYYSIFQSSNGIFSYLILIESGFSVAYLLKMYEPYAHGDTRKLQELYLGLEHMMTRVAWIMLLGVAVVTIIYPLILAENALPQWELLVLIALSGIKFVLPYFFTVAKKQILNVVEKSYLITSIDSAVNLVTDIIIIFIALFTSLNFLWTVIASVLMLIPSIVIYTIIVNRYKKQFHFLPHAEPSYEASSMTKDIMAQKIAYLADNNVDQIILSTQDLLQTTIYTSFNSVVSYPVTLVNQLIASFRGHMGVRLADNTADSYQPFRKLFAVNFYIATVISCEFILQAQNFVKLWIGSEYSTANLTLILFALVLFRKCAENSVTIVREGRDLYKESKKYALLAALINFVLSLLLVRPLGINGLLIATIIADFGILDINNYRLVFNKVFNRGFDILPELFAAAISMLFSIYIRYVSPFADVDQSSWLPFVLYSAVTTLIVVLGVGFVYFALSRHIRMAAKQFMHR